MEGTRRKYAWVGLTNVPANYSDIVKRVICQWGGGRGGCGGNNINSPPNGVQPSWEAKGILHHDSSFLFTNDSIQSHTDK